MAIHYQQLKQRAFAPQRQHYTQRDSMLYALSLGVGNDPLDESALPFVYEGMAGGLRPLPSQAVVLGYPGFWAREPDTGIDWVKVLHGEQRMRLHMPLPAEAEIVGYNRITHITEVVGLEGDVIVTQDLFVYEITGEDANGKVLGRHRSTGIGRPRFWERARYYNEEKRLAAALDAAEVANAG